MLRHPYNATIYIYRDTLDPVHETSFRLHVFAELIRGLLMWAQDA